MYVHYLPYHVSSNFTHRSLLGTNYFEVLTFQLLKMFMSNIKFWKTLFRVCLGHIIIKQCVFVHVGPKHITMGYPNLVLRRLEVSLDLH